VALQDILNLLLRANYLAVQGSETRKAFRLTEKGRDVLSRLEMLNKDFDSIMSPTPKDPILLT
jgi:predicted transcriptional regulator